MLQDQLSSLFSTLPGEGVLPKDIAVRTNAQMITVLSVSLASNVSNMTYTQRAENHPCRHSGTSTKPWPPPPLEVGR
jgi:hypothetical protein